MTSASGPQLDEGEETWSWWSEEPDFLKVEFSVGNETVRAWFRGGTWWSWSPSRGAMTNEGRENVGHGKGPCEALVSPTRAARSLDFELVGELSFLGRPAYRLLARPFTRGDFDLHNLGSGADQYELVVDAERGFLLRAEARLKARAFRVLEMTEVIVDDELPAGVFVPDAPDGERFEFFEPVRRLSLEELPRVVPFRVFVPARAPGRLGFVELFSPGRKSGKQLFAHITYFVPKPGGTYANLWLNESAAAMQEPRLPTENWRQVDGFMVGTDESMGFLRCKVVLEREGTHIRLESTAMAPYELVDLARSLVPLSYI